MHRAGLRDACSFDRGRRSTGWVSFSEPRSLQHLAHALELPKRRGAAAQADAHHQDLEVGHLREIRLGADAHRGSTGTTTGSTMSAIVGQRRSGCVIATIIAPCSRATSTALSRLRIRPTYEIASTTSRAVHRGGRDQLQVRVEVRARRDAEPREARLGVARHEHRHVADAVAVDAPRPGDPRDGALELPRGTMCRSRFASALTAPCRTLCVDRLHVVAGRDRAVQRRLPDRQVLRQPQLELAQARAAQRAAEARDRRRAHAGAAREHVDVGAQREFRVLEHRGGDLPLRLRQRCGTFAHRGDEVARRGAQARRGRVVMARPCQKKVRIAPVTR